VRGTGTVELLGPGDNVVGTGILQDNIKYGMELKVCTLSFYKYIIKVCTLKNYW
jgi:hypothetical protein